MQNIYDARQRVKLTFLIVSVVLVAVFVYISNDLVKALSVEERNKMEIWAEATRELASENMDMNMDLILKVIQSNTSIPVIIADERDSINQYLNIQLPEENEEQFLYKN